MSFDFATEKVCPHIVVLETATIDSVTQDVIRFQRPPVGASIILYLNGLEVPPGGLYSTAEITTTNYEYFRITAGKDDLIYIDVGNGIPRIVQLLTGGSITASDLARDLSIKIPELNIVAENKRVVFRSRSSVRGKAFSFPDPRWTDKTSSLPSTGRILGGFGRMGIVPGRVASGKRLFPSWSLVHDPQSTLETARVIKLTDPLPNNLPIAQLTYTTAPANCRRCFGIRIEFDYNIIGGTYETVRDADLLSQELDKFMFTKSGSHWKWPWLGSQLINRIGGKTAVPSGSINSMISLDVSKAFSVYQNIKSLQASGYPFQNVTDAEFPAAMDSLSVNSLANDPTVAIVTAVVSTRSRLPVEIKRVVGNPNPFSVLSQDPSQVLRFAGQPDFKLRG
jgi:hypothetical protein